MYSLWRTRYAPLPNIFWDYLFLSRLYELYLSLKYLEKDVNNLLQNLHLHTQNLFAPQAQELLEKLAEIILYNFFIFIHKNLFAPQAQELLEKLAEIILYNFYRNRFC